MQEAHDVVLADNVDDHALRVEHREAVEARLDNARVVLCLRAAVQHATLHALEHGILRRDAAKEEPAVAGEGGPVHGPHADADAAVGKLAHQVPRVDRVVDVELERAQVAAAPVAGRRVGPAAILVSPTAIPPFTGTAAVPQARPLAVPQREPQAVPQARPGATPVLVV